MFDTSSQKNKQYILLSSISVTGLESIVESYLNNKYPWKCQGGPFYANGYFYQALVLNC